MAGETIAQTVADEYQRSAGKASSEPGGRENA